MKQITAFIKPYKLSEVTRALHKVDGLPGVSVSDSRGSGRARADATTDLITEGLGEFVEYNRIEIICADELVDPVIAVIEQSANTGLHGDGKIYVLPIEQAVRISTGERGDDAV